MRYKNRYLQSKIDKAIAFIQHGEKLALSMNADGYFVAFSGGKDSQVLLWLAQQAGVKYRAFYAVTTNDPPQNVQFIREHYPEVIFIHPKENFYKLVAKKGLPTMRTRYCCSVLKETAGIGYATLVGVRKDESSKRRGYRDVDVISRRKEHQDKERVYSVDEIVATEHKCIKGKDKLILRPILDFTESEVWEVIYANNLPVNPCYKTANRVGCIFCPFAPKKQILEYCKKYPRAKAKIIDCVKQYQTKIQNCKFSPDEYFDWWLSKKSVKQYIANKRQTKIEFQP